MEVLFPEHSLREETQSLLRVEDREAQRFLPRENRVTFRGRVVNWINKHHVLQRSQLVIVGTGLFVTSLWYLLRVYDSNNYASYDSLGITMSSVGAVLGPATVISALVIQEDDRRIVFDGIIPDLSIYDT